MAVTRRWVSGGSGSDANPGTKADPYKTIQRGISEVHKALAKGGSKPGQVLVEPGVYDEALVLFDDIEVLRADEKLAVTIDPAKGTYTLPVASQVELTRSKKGPALVTIKDVKRAAIRGLKIDGHTKGGRGIDIEGSANITIQGCLIWGHWTEVILRSGSEKGTLDDPYSGESFIADSSSGAGIRVLRSKTIDLDGNFFNNNRCDLKYSIPSPFDVSRLPDKVAIPAGGRSKELRKPCLIRFLRMMAEVYRNGGGAIFVENTLGANVEGSLFRGNQGARGGAIRFGNKAYEWIDRNYFEENEAWVDGGAIAIWDYDRDPGHAQRKTILIRDCRFAGNRSADDGGAVYLTAKTLARVEKCAFNDNASGSNGGALRVTFGSNVEVEDSTFAGNVANTDASTKVSDNKDGGGAIAVQNATLKATRCTFSRNGVRGFAGGALYVNTVKYDPLLESIGMAVYATNFDKILKKTYGFTAAELTIQDCTFSDNEASGKTCYESAVSGLDKLFFLATKDCDDLLKAYQDLQRKKQCSVPNGKGMTEGGAGGAAYFLEEKSGYLPLRVAIRGSSFQNDVSQHHQKEQRAEIVALECSSFEIGNLTIVVSAPTRYKLSLHNLVMKNVDASGQQITCSNSMVSTSDAEIYLRGVTCR